MASTKDLKKRIGTVKNTQQTTRAMKMVSAAKLRRAQEAISNHRPYAKRVLGLIRHLASGMTFTTENQFPLLRVKGNEATAPKRVMLVVFTSDRGLCGGFNGNAIKNCLRWIQKHGNQCASVEIGFVGRKGHDFFKTKKVKLGPYYHEISGKVTFAQATKLADALVDRFVKGEVDEIKFVYSEFKNAVTQQVVVEDFLPYVLDPSEVGQEGEKDRPKVTDYIVRPSKVEVLTELLAKNFAIQSFRVLLESQAGEHGARMSAMENATKNAGEMIRKLTLQYNKQRQAGITKELLEIISGSESQKG